MLITDCVINTLVTILAKTVSYGKWTPGLIIAWSLVRVQPGPQTSFESAVKGGFTFPQKN
jgi:hypothetical protein